MKTVKPTSAKELGVLLRRARTDAGMTLPALAIKARLPKSVLSTIENGKGNPCLSTLHKLSWALVIQITINLAQTLIRRRRLVT